MSRLGCVVALAASLTATVDAQNGRIVETLPLTLDESLRQAIIAKAEFTPEYKSAEDVFALANRVDMQAVTYLSDGLKVKGFIVSPRKAGRYPVVIWNRGGCRESVGVMSPYFVARWLAPFADWGYLLVTSQLRGAGGSEGKDEFGGADLNDVLNLLPLIDALPNADSTRIGMAGFSRGALMTFLALAKTDRIKAAIVAGSPANMDFATDAARRKELGYPAHELEDFCLRQILPNYDQNRQKEIDARSPIKWADKLNRNTPILMIHGTSDADALASGALEMATVLFKHRQPFRLLMLEGGTHDLVEYDKEVNDAMRAWLDHYVRDGKSWPSLAPKRQ